MYNRFKLCCVFTLIAVSSVSWSVTTLIYRSPKYQLTIRYRLYLPKYVYYGSYRFLGNPSYIASYRLLNDKKKILNQGSFKGCTYSTINFIGYLKSLVHVQPINHGFLVYYETACAAQSIVQLEVITPTCLISAPVTDVNGNYFPTKKDGSIINFGILKGFGAYREATEGSLTINNNVITVTPAVFSKVIKIKDKQCRFAASL